MQTALQMPSWQQSNRAPHSSFFRESQTQTDDFEGRATHGMDDASSAMEAATYEMKMQGMNQPHTMAKCPPDAIRVRPGTSAGPITHLLGEEKSIR